MPHRPKPWFRKSRRLWYVEIDGKQVNLGPDREQELDAVRRCLRRGSPMGHASWVKTTAGRLGLESTLGPRGRPRVRPAQKTQNNES